MPPRRSRFVRVGRVAGGLVLLAAGVVLLVLPGPGIPLVAGGLVLLAPEFRWARRARRALMSLAKRSREPSREPSLHTATVPPVTLGTLDPISRPGTPNPDQQRALAARTVLHG